MNTKLWIVVITALSFTSVPVVESSWEQEKHLMNFQTSKAPHAKLYNNLDKQDFIDDPPVSTVLVVNRTFQTLGALAIFTAFIIKPIIYAIFASAGNPIYEYRSFHSTSNEANYSSGRGILDRDRCIERISCEIANYTKGRSYMRRFAESVFPDVMSYPDGITSRIMKTLAKQSDVCYQYSCDPVGFLIRLFIYKIDWNTLLKS